MKKLENIISKIIIILITINLVVFSAIPNNSFASNQTPDSDLQQQIVDYAKTRIGKTPYVWGGVSLENGADCSGFVMAVYESFGYKLKLSINSENSRAEAMSRIGQQVQYSNVQLGDIVIVRWSGSGWSWHCGIYAGNGQYINCSSSKGFVISSNVPTNNVYAVTRIVGSVNGGGTSPSFPNSGGIVSGIIGFKPQGQIDNTDNNPIDLDSLEFDFAGSPSKMEYNGEKPISEWSFSKFSQFIDYITGIVTQAIKGAIVGWTAIIEGWINDILNSVNNGLDTNTISNTVLNNTTINGKLSNVTNKGI